MADTGGEGSCQAKQVVLLSLNGMWSLSGSSLQVPAGQVEFGSVTEA